ncbi:Gfo/Idh/MocA family protein [Glycomyces xiaoerkulensis]|uniref:Gfo/Idh/MocA family protein n=1 Tax=Glycomyces xiaoerkulensis TaxID=2038139 RepID=UPI000C258CC1|nr:Gfo/Idh/MocA family oxidoreductase [Glycomyces xiaoerkulensis]
MAPVTINRPTIYRAAIIGTGFMGRVHSHAITAAGGEITGISGSSPDRARQAADALRAPQIFDDADEAIAAADVVHVCTPNHLHAPIALAAIEAGKHVVCEKPLATDADTARAMTDAAEAAGVVAAVPFVYRFHPMVREARARVAAGGVGRLTLAHGSYLQDWLLHPGDDNWRVDADKGGALRAFGDIGSHWCDLLEFVTGDRITAVSAQLATANRHRGGRRVSTEDIVTLQFATRGGMVGTTVISQVSAGRKNRLLLEISGTEATVAFDQEQPETLWLGGRGSNAVLMRDPDHLAPDAARLAHVPGGHPQGYQDCFNDFVADVGTATTGPPPDGLPAFADGLRAARIAEAVAASAGDRDWVEVPA